MKRLLLIAIVAASAMAKPGLYKEKEDFQYSRSSTDEGSKSGYYGAQRGNMGGNYERAHNMDGLAQHQMGGLVRQVEGELGEGSQTRTGSVFTAANSRGIYGSGHYDLKNLEGRNFQEGVSYDDSQSLSQLQSHSTSSSHSGYNAQSSAMNSAAYINRQSHGSRSQGGYNGYQYSGHNGVDSNLQQTQNLHAGNQYDYGGQEAAGYFSQSAYNGQSAYDQSRLNQHSANSYGSNAQTRLLSTMPVKVVLRPGTKVAVPVAAETYDASNTASNSAYNHNSVNNEAELLTNQHSHNNNYKPTGAKHYESSYSYKKEWEKHDTQPVTVLPIPEPTANPFPKNSELYEDTQSLSAGQQYQSTGVGSQRSHSHSSHSYGGYNANVNSASSSQSQHQHAYNAQHHRSASSGTSDYGVSSQGTSDSGVGVDSTNQIEDINNKPKSYHSSYSYHKSWERQGDPYVIKPASSGYGTKASERLTAASSNQGAWSSQRYGSHYQQGQQNVLNLEDCDEHGHIRVARSYNTNQYEQQNAYQRHQHNQDQEVLGQQSQNLEDLTQQSQNQWDKLEDLGQQTQNKWDQSQDLNQQSQSNWDQSQDLSQQSQSNWDQSQDLSQQSQSKWEQSQDLSQQSQSKWEKSQDLSQQSQSKWDQTERLEDLGQQTQTQWDKLEDGGQQTQSEWHLFHGQQPRLDNGQQLQSTWSQWETSGNRGVGQETETNWGNNEKPSIPSSETEESNIFNAHGSTTPKENLEHIPDKPQNPWNTNFNAPINNNNKYWEQLGNGNIPTPANNHFNNPWFSQFPSSQGSEDVPSNNYHNQQSHMYNAWGSHWPSISSAQPHNTRDESSTNYHDGTETKPSNNAHDTSMLWNLWNKVDTIEKQTISTNKNKTEESQYSLQTKPTTEQVDGDSYGVQPSLQNNPFMHQYGHNFWAPQDFNVETSTASTPSTTKKVETSTISVPTLIINKEAKSPQADVGRGDIGPEDSDHSTAQSNSQETFDELGTQSKPDVFVIPSEHQHYKTPAEIEALSQVIDSDKKTTDSTETFKEDSFTGNPQEQSIHKLKLLTSTTSRSIIGATESGISYQNMGQYNGNTVTIEAGKSTESNQPILGQRHDKLEQSNLEQQNIQQQFTTLEGEFHKLLGTNSVPLEIDNGKKPINAIETGMIAAVQNNTITNENVPESHPRHPWRHPTGTQNNKFSDKLNNSNSSMIANKVDYYPWLHQAQNLPENNGQTQRINHINQQTNLNNQNFDLQNTGQQFENVGQQSENLGQQSENFGQQSEKFDQHNENVGQQSEQFDQQYDNFGQQSENLGQQSEKFDQQFDNFGQQSENLGQQSEKFDQQFDNFGQQRENLGQQSEKFDQQFDNFGQQSENLGQQSEKFDQQFDNFGQQSENLGQQSEKFDQQFDNFGQQSENLGQPSEKFDQQFDNFGQQSENLGQQSEKFDQQFDNFGQNENLAQNTNQQLETFQQVENGQLPRTQQFENFWKKLDNKKMQDAEQEQINLSTPNKKPEQSPVEPEHKIHNAGTSSGINIHSMYEEHQSENWKQDKDLGQQIQTGWEQHENLDEKANVQEIQNLQVIPVEKPVEKVEIPEDRAINTQSVMDKDLTSTTLSTPPETDKDKPGFWKSVGNKFVNAKDKVFSWFSSS